MEYVIWWVLVLAMVVLLMSNHVEALACWAG
jgi:hypothetical protein